MSRARHSREGGAAAVEFAMVLPILLFLLFGIIEFSRAYNANVSLSGAAREGARVVALGTGDALEVVRASAPSLQSDLLSVNVSGCAGSNDRATVTVTYPFGFVTPLAPIAALAGMTGDEPAEQTFTLTGIGVMRCGG